MIGRVATFAINRQMLEASLKTQSRMASLQLQEASGLISTDYGGLGGGARKLIDLEVAATRSERYETAASGALADTEAIFSIVQSIADLLDSVRSTAAAAQSASATESALTSLASVADAGREELASLLNTQLADRYLFAGDGTNSRPVNVDVLLAADDPADGAYYDGSASTLSVQVSEHQLVSYGVLASDEAFAAAFSAMSKMADATVLTEAELSAAYEQLSGAIDAIADIQGGISVSAVALERAVTHQQDLSAFYDEQIVTLRDVDVTAVAAQLTAYETQLQASYSALAKLQSLSLTDYLG